MRPKTFMAAMLLCITLAPTDLVLADSPPYMEFDTPFTVSCIDVTPRTSGTHTNSKLIEVRIDISAVLKAGKEEDLDQVMYELLTQGGKQRYVLSDLAPKTTTYTDIVNPILMIEESSSTISGGTALRGEYKVIATADIKATLTNQSRVEYAKLPPQSLVVASGFMDRHAGAFFKLKPTSQGTIEGSRSFSLLMTVPSRWRHDWIDVRCHAIGYRRGWLIDSKKKSGLARFSVGLYLEGDVEAQELAQRLADTQQEYFDELWRQREQYKRIVKALKWLLKFASPMGASSGMSDEIMTQVEDNPGYADRLSPEVREKLKKLNDAKASLREINKE